MTEEDVERLADARERSGLEELAALADRVRELEAKPASIFARKPEPEVGDLVAALAEAQAELEQPKRSRTVRVQTRDGGSFEYHYAELTDVISAAKAVLAPRGIAFIQPAETDLERKLVRVWTAFLKGEQRLDFGPLEMPLPSADVQTIGSAITYGRRYLLSTALGIAAEHDDDGVAASSREDARPERKPAPATKGGTRKATEAQMRRLHAVAKTKGITHQQMTDWAGRHLGIETLAELTTDGARELSKALSELPDAPDDATATVEDGGTPAAGPSESDRTEAAVASDAGARSDSVDTAEGESAGVAAAQREDA